MGNRCVWDKAFPGDGEQLMCNECEPLAAAEFRVTLRITDNDPLFGAVVQEAYIRDIIIETLTNRYDLVDVVVESVERLESGVN